MTDEALTALRHRHHRRVASGIWHERDRDIAALLATVDHLTALLDGARIRGDAYARKFAEAQDERDRWEGHLHRAARQRDAIRDQWYRRLYGEA